MSTATHQDALPLDALVIGEAASLAPMEFRAPAGGPPRYAVIGSPIGDMLLTGDGESLTGLFMLDGRGPDPVIGADWTLDVGALAAPVEQLRAYFAGELREFDVPLAPSGTPFQLDVWRALTTIPYGRTTSYGRIAAALGRSPGASRAVGLANGRNPISVIIPCHRVIGSDGSLIGYGGGLPRKAHLLAMERAGR
ncbi:MAG: methylated-DNA--[protein]-cysteine S-methyltransferase [Frankiaceae bacterium]